MASEGHVLDSGGNGIRHAAVRPARHGRYHLEPFLNDYEGRVFTGGGHQHDRCRYRGGGGAAGPDDIQEPARGGRGDQLAQTDRGDLGDLKFPGLCCGVSAAADRGRKLRGLMAGQAGKEVSYHA